MTFIKELDPYLVKISPQKKHELPASRLLKVIMLHTYVETYRHHWKLPNHYAGGNEYLAIKIHKTFIILYPCTNFMLFLLNCWMTLNGIMAIILHYFAEFGSFRNQLRKKWLISHQQIFSREMSLTPTKHDGRAVFFAVTEHLVRCAVCSRIRWVEL